MAVALAAMGIGALGLPLDLSNLLGGSMVLIFALFSRFLLNGSRIPDGKMTMCGFLMYASMPKVLVSDGGFD